MPSPARAILAGGASSPVRAGKAAGGVPFVQAFGRGAHAYDEVGRAYVDYVMAYGPLLFGHAHPALVGGLDGVAARGTVFGATSTEEVRLAQRIANRLPSMEALRFTTTGTEAVMSAVRVARAYTGRSVIARFAGNYHGHFDLVLHDAGASAQGSDLLPNGIPPSTRAQSVIARYNDLDDLDAQLADCGSDLAAILVEPVAGNMGLVLPRSGFLTGIFERARRHGALVIFDEVITWLRLGLGGAQRLYGCVPDLTALGKVMGGGFPLAAFGGRADVMLALAPDGAAFTGGTFSGNPFSVALGHRVLDLIDSQPEIYDRLEVAAQQLADGMRTVMRDMGLPYTVSQLASMVDFKFRAGPPVRNYDEARTARADLFAAYYHAMRERGVLLAPSQNELMFVSTEHQTCDIDRTIEACASSLSDLRRKGLL